MTSIKLSHEDTENLGKISGLLLRMYSEKDQELFEDDLLNKFFAYIAVMIDETEGTGRIAEKYIGPMKEFIVYLSHPHTTPG